MVECNVKYCVLLAVLTSRALRRYLTQPQAIIYSTFEHCGIGPRAPVRVMNTDCQWENCTKNPRVTMLCSLAFLFKKGYPLKVVGQLA